MVGGAGGTPADAVGTAGGPFSHRAGRESARGGGAGLGVKPQLVGSPSTGVRISSSSSPKPPPVALGALGRDPRG